MQQLSVIQRPLRLVIEQSTSVETYASWVGTGRGVSEYVVHNQDVLLHLDAWLLTQWLMEDALWLARRAIPRGRDVVELCAGIGLVSVAMLVAFPNGGANASFHVLATDISLRGLELIARNAKLNLAEEDLPRLETAMLDVTAPLPGDIAMRVAHQHRDFGRRATHGLDVVVGAWIDTEFAGSREDGTQGFSAQMLPTIRALMGVSGRAWAMSRIDPASKDGSDFAASLASAGLEVEQRLHPEAAGLLPSPWEPSMPVAILLLLRPRHAYASLLRSNDL